jgi:hypothetical protein
MTVDLLAEQAITVLLPDGSRLVLSHMDAALRLEHWQGHSLSSLFTLPCHHDHHQQSDRDQQAHLDRPAPLPVYPTSRTL